VEPLFDISPKAFVPPPKVTSSVVELRPRPAPAFPAEIESLQKVTAAAFGQRRKMLRQSLKSLGGDALALLEAAEIEETARAEELSLEDFCRLSEVWRKTRG
jgi:16S rRNA (adenine1518-N6/adenine1519-N6)-dimethyltransferase